MALVVLGYEKDIGTSLLFFGVFASMLYITTRRGAYVVGTLVLLAIGSVFAYHAFGHVRVRVDTWINPWKDASGRRLPDHPVVVRVRIGRYRGNGTRPRQPQAHPERRDRLRVRRDRRRARARRHDRRRRRIHAAVGSAFRIAVDATRPFAQLFAAGIATILGFQSFLIIGGVTRIIPLTGITLPFVSYGGSSLVANFALLAILLRISDDKRARRARVRSVVR